MTAGVSAEAIEAAVRSALAPSQPGGAATTATCTPATPVRAKAATSPCASPAHASPVLSRVARHRLVYDSLRLLMPRGHPRPGHRGPCARRTLKPDRTAFVATIRTPHLRRDSCTAPKAPSHEVEFLLRARATTVVLCSLLALPLAAYSQNLTTVNGKAVPKSRVDDLLTAGGARRPEGRARRWKRRPATRWCCARSSPRKPRRKASPLPADYRVQMELARQSILIRELFEDFKKKNPVHRRRGQGRVRQVQGAGLRHRVPRAPHPGRKGRRGQGADQADQGRRQLRGTGQEELEGSGIGRQRRRSRLRQGRCLRARVQPGDGEAEEGRDDRRAGEDPVRLPHHQARRHARGAVPGFEDVKPQIVQRLEQVKLQPYQEELRKAAKTDYKFPSKHFAAADTSAHRDQQQGCALIPFD